MLEKFPTRSASIKEVSCSWQIVFLHGNAGRDERTQLRILRKAVHWKQVHVRKIQYPPFKGYASFQESVQRDDVLTSFTAVILLLYVLALMPTTFRN